MSFNSNMLRVSEIETRKTRIPYTATNVGVLQAPDHLPRYGRLSDYEMEKKFRELNARIDKKTIHRSFEDKHDTPFLLKYFLAGGALYVLWKSIKK